MGADLLLTVKEAAERLKISAATVYALCEGGKIAFTRVSTHAIRISEADLAAYAWRLRVPDASTKRGAPSR